MTDLRRRNFIFALVFFSVLWLALFYRMFGGYVLSGGDLVNHYIPNKVFFRESILDGRLPLWNPYTFSGRPFQADIQNGVFYPPGWLSLLFPVPLFFTIVTVLHGIFASLGAFYLSRRFVKRFASRLMFALVFSFSAFFTARLYSGIVLFIFAASWIPWIYEYTERWRWGRKPSSVMILAVFLALQLLSGSPQVAYYTWLSLLVLFLIDFRRRKETWHLYRGYLAAFLLFIALAAIQFIPTKEFVDHSYERAGGASLEYATQNSLQPGNLVTFLAPGFFSHPEDEIIYWGSLGYWEYNGYVGILTLLLMVAGFLSNPFRKSEPTGEKSHPRRYALFFLVLFLAWPALAFGKYSPFFYLFYYIMPGFNRFRVPSRTVLFFILAAAYFSSVGFDSILDISQKKVRDYDLKRKRLFKGVIVCLIAGFAAGVIFFLFPETVLRLLGVEKFFKIETIMANVDDSGRIPVIATRSVSIFLSLLTISGLLISCLLFKGRRWKIFTSLLLVLLSVELLYFGISMLEMTRSRRYSEEFYPETPLIRTLRDAGESHERIVWEDSVFDWLVDQNQYEIYPNRGMMNGIYDVRGYDPVYVRRYAEFFNAIGYYREEKSPGAFLRLNEVRNPVLLSLLNVRYLLTYYPLREESWEMVKEFPFGLMIYRNPSPIGTAFLGESRPSLEMDRETIIRVLANRDFPFRKWVMTEDVNREKDYSINAKRGDERVELLSWSASRRIYNVKAENMDVLVLSEAYYPGWKVYVDGKPGNLFPADHALMGVFVEPGNHEVRFEFKPFSFYLGAIISLITMAGMIVTLFIMKRRA